jgi:hypothetical protein
MNLGHMPRPSVLRRFLVTTGGDENSHPPGQSVNSFSADVDIPRATYIGLARPNSLTGDAIVN